LQDSEAQERCAGDLQEPAPQTAPGLKIFNDLAIERMSDFKMQLPIIQSLTRSIIN
jgi:hypothetical protein